LGTSFPAWILLNKPFLKFFIIKEIPANGERVFQIFQQPFILFEPLFPQTADRSFGLGLSVFLTDRILILKPFDLQRLSKKFIKMQIVFYSLIINGELKRLIIYASPYLRQLK